MQVRNLVPAPYNPREIGEDELVLMGRAMAEYGDLSGIIRNRTTGNIIGGHQRVKHFDPQAPIHIIEHLDKPNSVGTVARGYIVMGDELWGYREVVVSEQREMEMNVAANQHSGRFKYPELPALLSELDSQGTDLGLLGFTEDVARRLLGGTAPEGEGIQYGALVAKFLVPPFSVLDARKGYWMQRKAAWLSLGIQSELGRYGGAVANAPAEAGEGGMPGQLLAKKRSMTQGGLYNRQAITTEDGALAYEDASYAGVSVFDPVLCELVYRWFSPPGGAVLDPFAGGSVRGIVAGWLGLQYHGIDLSEPQVQANQQQARDIIELPEGGVAIDAVTDPAAITPVQRAGTYWFKRDDAFQVAGVCGGKARTCWGLGERAAEGQGIITSGMRTHPQLAIVAAIAEAQGRPCRIHVPSGDSTPEMEQASESGATLVLHKPGHGSVVRARARTDAEQRGWVEVPYNMAHGLAVEYTAAQTVNLPWDQMRRLVVCVGSGMTLCGVLVGIPEGCEVPVLGVCVGGEPEAVLDRWFGLRWADMVKLVYSGLAYHKPAPTTELAGVQLDPIYEAKAIEYLRPGDCLWVLGRR
jgi:1-aminocyclopropane-1-carboxylate deaminase/D-cysteine desulfhydrase-like pyridoxal-dependent ACC family enzyme